MIYEPRYQSLAVTNSPSGEEASAAVSVPPPLLARIDPDPVSVDGRTTEMDRDPPQRVWRVVPVTQRHRAPAWVVGSMVHDALAAWRFPDASFERWAEARSRTYGLTDAAQTADAVREP